jgi:Bacterial dnaA protein helix-turn-helix
MAETDRSAAIWRQSLEQIDSTVSAQLGPGRVVGNVKGPCFSRQISMYLAKQVGGWSTVKIGRFYNGRHHTTVLHAIQKVQRLRSEDESLDAIVEVLIAALREDVGSPPVQSVVAAPWQEEFVEAITARVLNRLAELGLEPARIVQRSTSVQSETNFDRAALLKRDAAAGVMRAARRSSRCRQYSCATGS